MRPNSVYDDEGTDLDNLERSFHAPSAHGVGSDARPGTRDMSDFENRLGNSDSSPIVGNNLRGRGEKSSAKAESADALKNKEESQDNRYGNSAADDIKEKLGLGFTGKGSGGQSKGLAKLFGGKSKLKKKVAIAGAAAGGSAIAGVFVFLAMLPLKIETVISNLDNKFSAASEQAIGNESDRLLSGYFKSTILPGLHTKSCHSTASPNCVFVPGGTGPFKKLYTAWSQSKLEQKMATKYGIVIQSEGSNYNLSTGGHSYKIKDNDIFDLDDVKKGASTSEVRQAVRNSFKDATLYDKVFTRFKYGKLLEAKYGIKRCVIACDIRDNFHDKVTDKKNAAKAYIVQRVVSPFSDEYSLLIQCIIGGASTCGNTGDNTASSPDENGDQESQSSYQRGLQSRLDNYAAKYGTEGGEKLAQLAEKADEISKNGFTNYLASQMLQKLGVDVGSEDLANAENPLKWLGTAAGLVNGINKIKELNVLGYAMKSAAAAQLYMTYHTVADEAKSGHVDATELGSFTDQLSGLAKDNNGNSSDMTAAPLYAKYIGDAKPNTASIFGSLFSGNVYADSTDTGYKCNDGNPPPSGSSICQEESFTNSSEVANAVANVTDNIPGWSVLSQTAGVVGSVLNGKCDWKNPLSYISSCIGDAVSHFTQFIPGVDSLTAVIGKLVSPLMKYVMNFLLPNPFSATMSGGRTFDMISAGSDVSQNKSCQIELGCSQGSDTAVAAIQNQQIAEEKQAFDNQNMFARIFSTDSQYSLVSRLALDMPTSFTGATNNSAASLLTNPLTQVLNGISSIFSGNQAFAAATPQSDPFGVTQNIFNSSDIPSDPQSFWEQNCTNGPYGVTQNDDMNTLDISKWLNNDPSTEVNGQPNTAINSETGETYNLKSNPCLLIRATIQSVGATSDPSLLPSSDLNDSSSSSDATGDTSGVSGNSQQLAQQVLSNSNITLGPTAKADLQAAANGQKVTPGPISGQSNGSASTSPCKARTPVYLNATLLQGMLNIAAKYKYQIQDITSGHDCDSGRHPLGRAFDIFQVNGKDINGHCTDQDIYSFLKSVTSIMSQLQPNGSFVNGQPVNMSGIGSCNPAEDGNTPSWVPNNINYFYDSSDQIHVDVGVAGS